MIPPRWKMKLRKAYHRRWERIAVIFTWSTATLTRETPASEGGRYKAALFAFEKIVAGLT